MAYRALKRLHLGNEVYAEPGDIVTEAMEWNNVQAWVSTGFLEEVPDSEIGKKPAKKTKDSEGEAAAPSDEVAPATDEAPEEAAPEEPKPRKRTSTRKRTSAKKE